MDGRADQVDHVADLARSTLSMSVRARLDQLAATSLTGCDVGRRDAERANAGAAQGVPGLAGEHSPARLEAACAKAVAAGDPSYRTIKPDSYQ